MGELYSKLLMKHWHLDHDLELQRDVMAALIQRRSWATIILGQIIVVWAFAYVLWQENPEPDHFIWAGTLTAIILTQAAMTSGKDIRALCSAGLIQLRNRFTFTALLVGASWIASAIFLFPFGSGELQLFFTFAFGGMAMSAVATQHVFLPACFVSMGLSVPCLAVQFVRLDTEYSLLQAFLLLLYSLVLITMAVRFNDFSMKRLRLQREKETLLEAVSKKAQELEEARKAEEAARLEAEEANAAKSRFLAQSSHDLRQPLHAMGLFLETISSDAVNDEVGTVLEQVRRSLDVLSGLFDSLLDISLLDTGQVDVRKTTFRLGDVLEQIAHDFAPIAGNDTVELRVLKTEICLFSDPVIVRRMIQNLVSNALRYTPHGKVLIGVRRRSGRFAIEVHDTGHGIAQEDQERVFQEFTRLAQGKGEGDAPGLGLGLAIVKRLASILDLEIGVKSTLGAGSSFSLCGFEAADVPVEGAAPLAATMPITRFDGLQVAVIDDNTETLEATGALLAKWGCRVETSADGLLQTIMPDVLVCDFELGEGKTGLDVIARLRGDAGKPLPAVIISGNTSPELFKRTKALNLPLLRKPVRPAQLRSAMLSVLT